MYLNHIKVCRATQEMKLKSVKICRIKISCKLDYITEDLVVSGKGPLFISEAVYDFGYSVYGLFYRGSDDNNCNIPVLGIL